MRAASRVMSRSPRPGRLLRRVLGRAAGQEGFTLLEMVIGLALLGFILVVTLLITSAGWRTEVQASTDYEVQRIARDMMKRIVDGDPRPAVPVKGLRAAREVLTDPDYPALAYRVTWKDSSQVEHDDAVCYYVSGGKLYRVVSPYVSPLAVVTTGGTELTDKVAHFGLSQTGAIPVQITLTITHPRGASITVQTRVTPRNLDSGG